jgi:hypothetical protein
MPIVPIAARYATAISRSQPTTPVVSPRTSTTPWYSGVTATTACNGSGYAASGKKVAENKNIGMIASWMNSKSCQLRIQVVAAIPAPANAYPISTAAGSASTAHHDSTRPIAAITTTNIAEYRNPPRSSPQVTSPVATSHGRSGVASTAS